MVSFYHEGKRIAILPFLLYDSSKEETKEVYTMLFVCYPRCTTCKKAQKWLDENQVGYTFRDIKEDNPTLAELQDWHARSGLPL